MLRAFLLTAAVLATAPAAPATAQPNVSAERPQERCRDGETRRRGSNLLRGVARRTIGRIDTPSTVRSLDIPTESLLSEAISRLLDCRERQQAATATNDAVRGGVGTRAEWRSETRANVSGSSTAEAEERLADGTHCLTVTNIVIVDGEETRAPQRMCRSPGARGYARV